MYMRLSSLLILSLMVGFAQSPPAQTGAAHGASTSSAFPRRYQDGESLQYHMKASNQGRSETIHYEANAQAKVRKNDAGHFVEEFQWTELNFNGKALPLSPDAVRFRQQLSLDPSIPPTPPDFSRVMPALIGPCADLLTFYADLWLAAKQNLVRAGDHAYVAHGTPSSWADGVRTMAGQDSIDFDITLAALDDESGTAKIVVRHVPPAKPQVQFPATWMSTPVGNTANNWMEVTKTDANGKYLAEVGKETFNVELLVSLTDGKLLSATMDNPVSVSARQCEDSGLTQCSQPERYEIRRKIELHLVP